MAALFVFIPLVAVAWLLLLIGAGVYAATRKEGGSDWFNSGAVRVRAIVAAALLSAVPTDILTAIWLSVVSEHVDATANLFLVAVAPVVAVIVTLQALALSRAYRPRPLLNGAIYLGVYAAAHAIWLSRLLNPAQDIIRHAAVILIVGSLVLLVFWTFRWRQQD